VNCTVKNIHVKSVCSKKIRRDFYTGILGMSNLRHRPAGHQALPFLRAPHQIIPLLPLAVDGFDELCVSA